MVGEDTRPRIIIVDDWGQPYPTSDWDIDSQRAYWLRVWREDMKALLVSGDIESVFKELSNGKS